MEKENNLTEKQQEELKKALDDIVDEAKNVVEDYTKNPSEISGSVIEIHENSPFMDDSKALEGNRWKKVITSDYLYDNLKKKKKKNKKA